LEVEAAPSPGEPGRHVVVLCALPPASVPWSWRASFWPHPLPGQGQCRAHLRKRCSDASTERRLIAKASELEERQSPLRSDECTAWREVERVQPRADTAPRLMAARAGDSLPRFALRGPSWADPTKAPGSKSTIEQTPAGVKTEATRYENHSFPFFSLQSLLGYFFTPWVQSCAAPPLSEDSKGHLACCNLHSSMQPRQDERERRIC
jgi:hypothetical protein